ncbi:hypothetical protein AB0L57_20145 [Nocardia sp. NPDC052254]|uniref:hypothetical protein n=1 Tax=Nocardia sp. NPDC052254 TaxID=3155681 RepID=UPI00343FB487
MGGVRVSRVWSTILERVWVCVAIAATVVGSACVVPAGLSPTSGWGWWIVGLLPLFYVIVVVAGLLLTRVRVAPGKADGWSSVSDTMLILGLLGILTGLFMLFVAGFAYWSAAIDEPGAPKCGSFGSVHLDDKCVEYSGGTVVRTWTYEDLLGDADSGPQRARLALIAVTSGGVLTAVSLAAGVVGFRRGEEESARR